MGEDAINLGRKLATFSQHWSPRVVAQMNEGTPGNLQFKLVKLQGEFVWHHHDAEDELFLVVRGRLTMQLRTGDVVLDPGEFLVVPHGVEHCPKAQEECWVLLLEPRTTLNTGNVVNERTRRELERL